MKKICNYCTRIFIENGLISQDEDELYSYAIEVLLSTIINITTTMLISSVLNIPTQGAAFTVVFLLLRKFTGGFHAESNGKCYFFSTAITFILLLLIRIVLNNMNTYEIIKKLIPLPLVLMLLTIYIFAPFENKNKSLTKKEKRTYKWIAFFIALISFSISTILVILNNSLFIGMSSGIILTALLLLFSVFKERFTDLYSKAKSV